MKKQLFKALSIINNIIPKKNSYLFTSFPDFTDNSFALFDYMAKNKQNLDYIWIVDNTNCRELKNHIKDNYNIKVSVYKKRSILGLYSFFRSKYIFFTHGIYWSIGDKERQIFVNLWHGMPLKNIGYLDGKVDVPLSTYTICTSNFFSKIMGQAFGLENKNVLLSGQPRNDLLFEDKKKLEKIGINKADYNNIIMWMPTYRKSFKAEIRIDAEDNGEILPLIKDKTDLNNINSYLKQENNLLIIKLHPMDYANNYNYEEYSNIYILNNNDLKNNFIQLYNIIGESDALITDYSSIYFDYLLLKKPIGLIQNDKKSYKASRGFVDNQIENNIIGEEIKNIQDFCKFIKQFQTKNEIKYDENNIFNEFYDKCNSQRLVDILNLY